MKISPTCDYPSRYIAVKDTQMHYLEAGQGEPVLFIHGMPTSSYLWRNILPALSDKARCIAVDLVGMGKSGKPDIDYTVFDHIDYLEGFIKAMGLKQITLVLHGWGSVMGFDYARRYPRNVKALAFFESHIRPAMDWDTLSLPVQQLATLLDRSKASYHAIVKKNYLVNKLLPQGVIRRLSEEEMEHYREPFQTLESRKVLWQYVKDLSLGEPDGPVIELIKRNSQWLQKSSHPKLMFYAVPGFITTIATVAWAKDQLPNLKLVELHDALHFAQESMPDVFSRELRHWYCNSV